MEAHQPSRQQVMLRLGHHLRLLFQRRLRDLAGVDPRGSFQQDAGGVAVGVAHDLAAFRVWGAGRDAKGLKRTAVDPGSMAALGAQKYRVVRGYLIQVSSRWERLIWPQPLRPAITAQPGPRLAVARARPHALQRCHQIRHFEHVNFLKGARCPLIVNVRIDQARQHQPPPDILAHCARCGQRQHVLIAPQRHNSALADREGAHVAPRALGINATIVQDTIHGVFLNSLAGGAG